MFVIVALTAQGSTRQQGVVQVNPYVNVVEFFGSQVRSRAVVPL